MSGRLTDHLGDLAELAQELDQERRAPDAAPAPEPEPKPWWLSKGMLGGLAGALVGGFGLARWGIDPGSLADLLSALATILAGVLATRGRATAQQPIAHGLLPKRTRYLPRGGD